MRGIESAPAIEIAMSSIAAIFTICSFRSLQLFPLQLFRLLRLIPLQIISSSNNGGRATKQKKERKSNST